MPLPPLEPSGRIARRDLALNGWVWMTFVVVFGILAGAVTAIPVLWPSFGPGRLWPFAALLGAVALGAHLHGPPRIGSVRNHVIIQIPSICTAIGVVVFAPNGITPVAAAAFAGTFAASRLQSRWELAAHLVGSGAILAFPLLLIDPDQATTLAIASMVPTTLMLGAATALVLEAAEGQGAELERLVRRDPLTGAGNQRHLDERMAHAVERSTRTRSPFSVLLLDLDGFKEYNAAMGRDAGDRLLQRVAIALEAVARPGDTLVRTGGDEFCLLLPDTSWDGTDTLLHEIRHAVADVADGGPPISASIGAAVFPVDARDQAFLMEAAETRLSLEKYERRAARALPDVWEPTVVPAPVLESDATEPRLDTVGGFTQVSRHAIAVNPAVWFMTGMMFAVYTVLICAAFILFSWPGYDGVAFCVGMGGVSALLLLREPPALASWLNQLVVATPYAGSLLFVLVAPELAGAMLGPIAFAGPLAAVRLVSRRQIATHFSLATVAIAAIGFAGIVPVAFSLGLLVSAVVMWSIGASDVLHLESADDQCAELDALVRVDPVTGLGNRRRYAEQLEAELRRAHRTRKPFSLIAVNLDGFATLQDSAGQAAADALLRRAAETMQEQLPAGATLVRRGGDAFCVLLPALSDEGAQPIANALRVAITKLGTAAAPTDAGVGVAAFPLDASDGEVLRHVAEWRVKDDKLRRRGLPGGRRASDPPLPTSHPAPGVEDLKVFERRPAVDPGRAARRRSIRRRSA